MHVKGVNTQVVGSKMQRLKDLHMCEKNILYQ